MVLRRVCIVHNPEAGPASHRQLTGVVASRLREIGHEVRVDLTRGPGHGTDLAERALHDGFNLVVAAGGDGTVNEVLQPLAGSDAILGVIPAGTVNLWATEAGLPARPDALARLLSAGDVRRIDVGRVGGRRFLLMASVGLDAATVQGLNLALKRRVGRLAYGASFLTLATRYRGSAVNISLDGRIVRCTALALVVGNTRRYAGPFLATNHAVADDGMLDVVVVRGETILDGVGQLGAIASGFSALRQRLLYGRARVVVVESETAIPLQVDGDFHGFAPARFETLPCALRVLTGVPEPGLFAGNAPATVVARRAAAAGRNEEGARRVEAG